MSMDLKIKSNEQFDSDGIEDHIRSVGCDVFNKPFTIKAVFCRKEDGSWDFVMGRCDLEIQGDQDVAIYANYAFVTKHFSESDIGHLIKNISTEGVAINAEPLMQIKLESSGSKWKWELIPSHAAPDSNPNYLCSINVGRNTNTLDAPLIGYNQPFFESSDQFIKEFLHLDQYYGNSDARKGHFLLHIPNAESKIEITDNQISINSSRDDVCIVGCLPSKKHLIVQPKDQYPLNGEEILEIELWLITKNNEVLDYRSQTTWPYKIGRTEDKQSNDYFYSMIEQGENLNCEFKPYIDLSTANNKKAFEIEKTACAFSNARGGNLLIGVTDDGTIIGINEKVRASYGESIENSLEKYRGDIKKRLYEALFDSQCCDVSIIGLGADYIVVVSVSRSAKPNYLINSKQSFVRKGATSAKMAFVSERNDHDSDVFGWTN